MPALEEGKRLEILNTFPAYWQNSRGILLCQQSFWLLEDDFKLKLNLSSKRFVVSQIELQFI